MTKWSTPREVVNSALGTAPAPAACGDVARTVGDGAGGGVYPGGTGEAGIPGWYRASLHSLGYTVIPPSLLLLLTMPDC